MIKVRRIAHATFDTPDMARTISYYADVIGLTPVVRDKDRAWLATAIGDIAIELRLSPQARCASLAFQVAPNTDLAAVARELASQGIRAQERNDPAPGISKVLAFTDSNGTGVELFADWSQLVAGRDVAGVGPRKLGHVAFFSPDPARIAEFYQRFLGFRVSDWIEDFFVFMRCNPDHHSVNFLRGDVPHVHHFAFELRDVSHIMGACDVLARHKIPLVWGPLRFGPGHNVATFHRAPDGQIVEFFAELDQMSDEELGYFDPRPWHRERPQWPKRWVFGDDMIWGPPPPSGFL